MSFKIWSRRGRMVVGIYNYLCNQCLSPIKLRLRIPFTRCVLDKVCQWLATGRWFSLGTLVSSSNKTDRHNITEILLKVAFNIINQNHEPLKLKFICIHYFITILFIFLLMFKTNMFHIPLAYETIQIITKHCQGRVVISLFSDMTL